MKGSKSEEVFIKYRKDKNPASESSAKVYFPLADGSVGQPELNARRMKKLAKSRSSKKEEDT